MAKQLIKNITFDSSLGTVTFNDYASIDLAGMLFITDVTNNVIIYNFADPLKGGYTQTNKLYLDYDTAGMDSSTILQVFYDDGAAVATQEGLTDILSVDVSMNANLASINANTNASKEELISIDNTAAVLQLLSQDITSSVALLKRIAKLLEPVSVQDSAQRQKVTVDFITAGVSLSTVSNAQSFGGVDYRWQIIDQARNTYSNSIRSNLSF